MKILIENDSIQIAYTRKQDIPFVVKIEREQENAMYVGQWSFNQHEEALNDADILHLLIKNSDEQNVGFAIIKGMTNQNDSIELMRIVIASKGSGYGKSALH